MNGNNFMNNQLNGINHGIDNQPNNNPNQIPMPNEQNNVNNINNVNDVNNQIPNQNQFTYPQPNEPTPEVKPVEPINYHDNYREDNPEEFKKQKRKFFTKIILIILFIIILIVGLIFLIKFLTKKDEKKPTPAKDESLKSIYIEDLELKPNFSNDVHDYYVLVDKDKINIKCETGKDAKLDGCDKEIDLSNMIYQVHRIYTKDNDEYRVYVKKKQVKGETLINITNVDIEDGVIKVKAVNPSSALTYSFDNGVTWQKSSEYKVPKSGTYYLIAKDASGNESPVREIKVTGVDKTKPNAFMYIKSSTQTEITLAATGKDSESNISQYSFDGKSFSTAKELKITSPGKYVVYAKDDSENISDPYQLEIKQEDFVNSSGYAVTYIENGSVIESSFTSCTMNNNSCVVTTPNITRENSEIIGWSTKKDSKTAEYKAGTQISVTKDMTLYAITKKNINVVFDPNGTNGEMVTKTCSVYNTNTCYVDVPEIKYTAGKIIGWNINKKSTSALVSSNTKIEVNDDITYYALAYTNLDATLNLNGSTNADASIVQCKALVGEKSCTITLPDIKRDGAVVLGWSKNKDSKTAEYKVKSEIVITENTNLYAITKKVVETTFYRNGANISKNKVVCEYYNSEEECEITTPKITRNGATIIGWNTDQNAKTSLIGSNSKIKVKNNASYYAITKMVCNINFNSNGADKISSKFETCSYYNSSTKCDITTPSITRDGWNVLGWGTTSNATKVTLQSENLQYVSKSGTYYAVTYKTVRANFHKYSAESLAGCTNTSDDGCYQTCSIYNTNNSCYVKAPYIRSTGNEVQLFAPVKNTNSLSGYVPGLNISIRSDIDLYAIVKNYYRKSTFPIIKTNVYGSVPIETTSGCNSSVYNKYYSFYDRFYKIAPYVFTAGKVTIASSNNYNDTWPSSAGMTYGSVVGYRNVDVLCTTNFNDYYIKTLVHEMVHAWDSYYKARYGVYLSSQSDVVSLYNKYKNASRQPLRDYSYSKIQEFVADMYSWYYFIYLDKQSMPDVVKNNTYYPSDMKKVMEKYIKIAKNGYK